MTTPAPITQFFICRPDVPPDAQPTVSKHRRQYNVDMLVHTSFNRHRYEHCSTNQCYLFPVFSRCKTKPTVCSKCSGVCVCFIVLHNKAPENNCNIEHALKVITKIIFFKSSVYLGALCNFTDNISSRRINCRECLALDRIHPFIVNEDLKHQTQHAHTCNYAMVSIN